MPRLRLWDRRGLGHHRPPGSAWTATAPEKCSRYKKRRYRDARNARMRREFYTNAGTDAFRLTASSKPTPDPAQQVPVIRSTFVHRRPSRRRRRETFSSNRRSSSVRGRVCANPHGSGDAKLRKWSNAEELSGCGETTLHFAYQEFLFLRHENVRSYRAPRFNFLPHGD